MSEKISHNFKQIFPALLFTVLLITDFAQGQWEFFSNNINWDLPILIAFKAIVLLLLILVCIKPNRVVLYILGLLTISLFLGYGMELFTKENLRLSTKYLSPFIYFFGFKSLIDSPEKLRIFEKWILWIIYFSLAAIIVGILFKIQSFRTYYYRFGYKGLFKRSIDASYFIMFSSVFIYFLKNRIKKPWIPALLILVSAVLIGTKLPLLFLFLFGMAMLYFLKLNTKQILQLGIGGIALVSVIVIVLRDKFTESYHLFYGIYKEKGVLSSITSFRSDLFSDAYIFYQENWTWRKLLFGGKIHEQALVEMSIPDLIIFFGILGGLLYLIFYFKTYFSKMDLQFQVFFLIIIFCSLWGGQFFFNQTVSLWFAVLALLLNKPLQNSQNQKAGL